jgi:hypothetical protein
VDPTLIFPALTGAISVLFWALMKEKDRQIADLKAENAKLEAKVEKMTDVLGQNTEALSQNATSQEAVVTMLRDLLGETSPSSSGRPPR